jgi:hypothetical protein
MAYSELAGMMSKALEQLQMFKSKVCSMLWLHQHVAAPEHTSNATEHVSPACVCLTATSLSSDGPPACR